MHDTMIIVHENLVSRSGNESLAKLGNMLLRYMKRRIDLICMLVFNPQR
jgi:hypothetical protein